MLRAVLASLIAAALMFVWGFTFWMFGPLPKVMMKPAPDEAALLSTLRNTLTESGVYTLPHCPNGNPDASEADKEAAMKRMESGPIVAVFYHKGGHGGLTTFGLGFVHMLASSLFASLLLTLASPGLKTFGARWLFVALLGVFASFAIHLAMPIWMMHPWEFWLGFTAQETVAWALAALPLAALVRPRD